MNYKSTDIQGK